MAYMALLNRPVGEDHNLSRLLLFCLARGELPTNRFMQILPDLSTIELDKAPTQQRFPLHSQRPFWAVVWKEAL